MMMREEGTRRRFELAGDEAGESGWRVETRLKFEKKGQNEKEKTRAKGGSNRSGRIRRAEEKPGWWC